MAAGVLPGTTSSSSLSCGIERDVRGHKCMCHMAPSSACVSVSEASSSFQNVLVLASRAYGRSTCHQTGVISFKGQLSSRRCWYRLEFKQRRKWERLKASASQESSRDMFLRIDRREPQVSYHMVLTPRNGKRAEDVGTDRLEEEKQEMANRVFSEDGTVLNTESRPPASQEVNSTVEGNENQGNSFGSSAAIGAVAAGVGLIVVLGGFGAVGYLYKDQLNEYLIQFSDFIEGYGPAGYGLFVLVYAGLELLAIPAIPLTMSAGLLFGATLGTIIVSIAGTIAATGAFLIARYFLRNRLLALTKGNKKFLAIDKAIGDDGFRIVTLLRLSPLLPFSLGNYLYGLTSVKLGPYVLGSWLGMLPGSWAYVSAGAIGRAFIIKQESEPAFSGSPEQLWTVGLGVAATVFAATYVTRIAKEALKDIDV